MTKSKIIKNPSRNIASPQYKPYIPRYRAQGLEPIEYPQVRPQAQTKHAPIVIKTQKSRHTPVASQPVQLPYAEIPAEDLDDEIVVETPTNARFHTPKNNLIPNVGNNIENSYQLAEQEEYYEVDGSSALSEEPSLKDYFLLIGDQIISSGSLEEVENEVRQLIYGEHDHYKINSADDLLVLKRVNIKVGVFIEE